MDDTDKQIEPDGKRKRSSTGRPLPFYRSGFKAKFTSAQIRKKGRYVIDAEALVSQPVTDAEVRVLILRLRDDLRGILGRGRR
jgi:hypothetical protein